MSPVTVWVRGCRNQGTGEHVEAVNALHRRGLKRRLVRLNDRDWIMVGTDVSSQGKTDRQTIDI